MGAIVTLVAVSCVKESKDVKSQKVAVLLPRP